VAQAAVDLDNHPELLVLDVAPSAVSDRGLAAASRKPVRPFDVTHIAKLRCTLRSVADISQGFQEQRSVRLLRSQ
jgi:hypothetical protein